MIRSSYRYWAGTLGIAVTAVFFLLPFAFIALTSLKDRQEAGALEFSWPERITLVENLVQVMQARDYMLIIAFVNSAVLTVVSVTAVVVLSAMAAFVMQRRKTRWTPFANFLVLSGLIVPPAVVPTIWVLEGVRLFDTMLGLVLVEVAFNLSFSILLFRAFVATVPREVDEAAIIDGAGPLRVFFRVIMPLLRPVIVTVVIVQTVHVFNDFTNPLYFLPSKPTVQLTLYNFQSQFQTSYNLLFMDILLITVPPLVMFIFFNRQIVAGMTAGAVKG